MNRTSPVASAFSARVRRRVFSMLALTAMALAACGTPGVEDLSGAGIQASADPSPAQLQAAEPPTGDAIDGGEPTEPATVEPEERFGPGVSNLVTVAQPLAEAEAWLAQLEVEWDNGMTYSEIFRAWRSVSAETGPLLTEFAVPSDADQAQTEALRRYHTSVQGAHDEWQATVDFIVTYITNYTPEILITKAYQRVEVHLRDAAEERVALGVPAEPRPEIVIEALIDL